MQNFYLTKTKVLDNIDFVKQNSENDYVNTLRKTILSDPFFGNKFYVHQFIKRVDDISGVKKIYHHPRLTKPTPYWGTTLLRVDPKNPDIMKLIWTLPQQEDYNKYQEGKIFGNRFVHDCIQKYLTDPSIFMGPEEGDLPEEKIKEIYLAKKKGRNAPLT